MKLIAGLGNPGTKYQETKHNLGFWVVDMLRNRSQDLGLSWEEREKFKAEIYKINYLLGPKSYELLLVKPQTFMNDSGLTVKALMDYYKLSLEDLIVIHDELDLPLGKIKISLGGSGAGHHGIESIIKEIGGSQFIRVRLGVGNQRIEEEQESGKYDTSEYVLEGFIGKDKVLAKRMAEKAAAAVLVLLEQGLDKAQNQFH